LVLFVACIIWRACFVANNSTTPINGPLSRTTRVSWYQKGKTSLDLLEHETVSGSDIS